MRDDLPNSDVAGQLHDDLLVTWFTDSDNVGFSNDLEKGPSVNELPKTSSRRVFLQARYAALNDERYSSDKRLFSATNQRSIFLAKVWI